MVSTLLEVWFPYKRNDGFLSPDRWDTDAGILINALLHEKKEKISFDIIRKYAELLSDAFFNLIELADQIELDTIYEQIKKFRRYGISISWKINIWKNNSTNKLWKK